MKRFFIAIAILIIAIFANYAFSRPEPRLARKPLKEFPKIIGAWKTVSEENIGAGSMEVLQVDDYIMRNYVNGRGEMLGLYIGYFYNQREGKQVHSPRQCLPGAGWHILESTGYLLSMEDHASDKVPVNAYVMGKDEQRQVYLWWYQGRGRIYANEYLNKLYLIWDAMIMNRTDGALVRVNMPMNPDFQTALETEVNFTKMIIPHLREYIPE
jgi:EpsI family protein